MRYRLESFPVFISSSSDQAKVHAGGVFLPISSDWSVTENKYGNGWFPLPVLCIETWINEPAGRVVATEKL